MSDAPQPHVAIVDYGMGNLFSIQRACECVGMHATVTASSQEILTASAVILPGVGAFGDAMQALKRLDLANVLRDVAASEKPLVGICLGMQLLLTQSYEFGQHRGLGIIEGEVVRLEGSVDRMRQLKVPQVGWNRIYRAGSATLADGSRAGNASWEDSPLAGLRDGEFIYFVHSFYVRPADSRLVLSTTRYGQIEFCSSLRRGNIFACQFHPERSGPPGLRVYRNLAVWIQQEQHDAGPVGSKIRVT